MAWTRLIRRDRLAPRMAVVDIMAGALGFTGRQRIQALHAWHPQIFIADGTLGFAAKYFRYFNWWNMMETTFGMIWDGVLAAGLWLNRRRISVSPEFSVTIPMGCRDPAGCRVCIPRGFRRIRTDRTTCHCSAVVLVHRNRNSDCLDTGHCHCGRKGGGHT